MVVDELMFNISDVANNPMTIEELEQFIKPKNDDISVSSVSPIYCNNIIQEIAG